MFDLPSRQARVDLVEKEKDANMRCFATELADARREVAPTPFPAARLYQRIQVLYQRVLIVYRAPDCTTHL